MWPTAVAIDGVELELDDVLANLVIRHGRGTIDDAPTASTVQLTLENVARSYSAPFKVGVELVVTANGAPRFTGTVTDAALDDDLLTVIAAGTLSTLSRFPIGAVDWPAEPWSFRVQRAFNEAGLASVLVLALDPAFDPLLIARPADPTDLLTYLGVLADDVGAAVADLPDGRVLVQALTARALELGIPWASLPASLAWAGAPPALAWQDAHDLDDVIPGAPPRDLTIPPADVLYVPPWQQTLELENLTTVAYGDPDLDLAVVADQPSSRDAYGDYPGELRTELANIEDATTRALARVDRRAFPRWTLPSVTVLTPAALTIGALVELSGFPLSSPHAAFSGILEGWTDSIDGEDWTMELALSDPVLSGVAFEWQDVAPADTWAGVNPHTRWVDATSEDALTT